MQLNVPQTGNNLISVVCSTRANICTSINTINYLDFVFFTVIFSFNSDIFF